MPILGVKEIINLPETSPPPPGLSPLIKAYCSLRGNPVAILNMEKIFGQPISDNANKLIVFEYQDVLYAIPAEDVEAIVSVPADHTEKASRGLGRKSSLMEAHTKSIFFNKPNGQLNSLAVVDFQALLSEQQITATAPNTAS